MVVVQYYICDGERATPVGMLAWDNTKAALGGIDHTAESKLRGDRRTVVTTAAGSRCLIGIVHPDQLREVSGADGVDVRETSINDLWN